MSEAQSAVLGGFMIFAAGFLLGVLVGSTLIMGLVNRGIM